MVSGIKIGDTIRYLLTINQAIGSQFENLIYSNIGDILLETLFACRVFSKR